MLLVVAGCGGEGRGQEASPTLPSGLAAVLASRSDTIATRLEAGEPCAARRAAEALQRDTIAAVNAGRVPARYQEELGAAVSSLLASIECAPAPPAAAEGDDDGDDGEGKSERKGERKGRKH